MNRPRPGAAVLLPRTPLYFGKVSGPGAQQLKAQVTARVVANRPFRLGASFQALREEAGKNVTIPPKQVTVVINGKEVPIGTRPVQIVTGGPTPAAGVDVPIVIELKMTGASSYPAGRYSGNLALTIMAD